MTLPNAPTPTETAWPALPYAEWAPTKKTFQMVVQMVAKVRLALAPALPEWLHACLYLDPRGFTTGPIPYGPKTLAIGIDVFDADVWFELSDGRRATVSLGPSGPSGPSGPNRTVAEIWADFRVAL